MDSKTTNNQRFDSQDGSPKSPKVRELEEKVLQLSGLELHIDLHIVDVEIEFKGVKNYIHTIKCGSQFKEDFVIIHGYGGCAALFYPMLKDLSTRFRVFCIDLLGMGLSSRPEFSCESTEDAIEFFMESLEKWREALGLKNFYLAGHSFGGYLCAHYALRHQDKIKRLFLFSPAGMSRQEESNAKKEEDNQGWIKKNLTLWKNRLLGTSWNQKIWEENLTPHTLFKKYSLLAKFVLRRYVRNQYTAVGKEESVVELLYNFIMTMYLLPESSEKALYYILKSPQAHAHVPLEDLIKDQLHIPVHCYYGERDWMDCTGAYRVSSQSSTFIVKQISDAGHQVPLQNPKGLLEEIILEILS